MLSFFPLDVLDETWDVIESVSVGFLTFFFNGASNGLQNKFQAIWNSVVFLHI